MRDKEDKRVDGSRRTWLIATTVAGGFGGVATVVPFVSSFAPSEKAKAAGAPVEVDISGLKPGDMMTVAWRGKPVWIINRTDEQLADVKKADDEVADPKSKMEFSMPLAGVLQQRIPLARRSQEYLGRGRLSARTSAARPRRASRRARNPIAARQLARRLPLPVPRLDLRPGRPRLQEQARAAATWTCRRTCSLPTTQLVIGKDEKGEA